MKGGMMGARREEERGEREDARLSTVDSLVRASRLLPLVLYLCARSRECMCVPAGDAGEEFCNRGV